VIFTGTKLAGAFIVDLDPHQDDRGFFARSWCADEFEKHGLNPRLVQCNISFNQKRGTLRGMHYQVAPHEEAKLARCTMGAIFDVMLDLRIASPTFRQWVALELTAENHRAVYIPEGFAHGFQTLTDHAEVFYQMSDSYFPDLARGVRWNDPAFGIVWPLSDVIVSGKDQDFPLQ